MSKWIEFVKQVQQQQGCSYKEALTIASPLWKQQGCGGISTSMTPKMKNYLENNIDKWNTQPKTQPVLTNTFKDVDLNNIRKDTAAGMKMALKYIV